MSDSKHEVPLHEDQKSTNLSTTSALADSQSKGIKDDGKAERAQRSLKTELESDSEESDNETFHDAADSNGVPPTPRKLNNMEKPKVDSTMDGQTQKTTTPSGAVEEMAPKVAGEKGNGAGIAEAASLETQKSTDTSSHNAVREADVEPDEKAANTGFDQNATSSNQENATAFPAMQRPRKKSESQVIESSHQRLTESKDDKEDSDDEEEIEWQAMPAIDEFDIFDDDGRLVARGAREGDEDENPYSGIGGAGKGYTRVLLDEDAQSATSLDEDTEYLFRKPQQHSEKIDEEDDEDYDEDDQRDVLGQLQATKQLLTEGQRIAYVGVVRLTAFKMLRALDTVERTKGVKKEVAKACDSMEMWSQLMMVRLYKHMEISTDEQLMIEQLAEHGLEPADLAPPLMNNAKVRNPMMENGKASPKPEQSDENTPSSEASITADADMKELKDVEEVPEVHGVEEMPKSAQIDLDIRWTVICDLFLVLVSDGAYDARSRRLLERVASTLDITWIQICRFEKRVMDQLEMEEAEKENWDESEHLESRRKKGLKRKYMMMGLATVGGGLVIGLSAGLMAPLIGAGLASGFGLIGVTGTGTFLAGVGGTALITSAATATGGTIAVRASSRRTGHVKTFEYRPLHNNKRLNLIITVSGWMTGKVDDVRLPFSTVDPIMGDIYSLLWEPEMLQSMGETINILATEALTQTIQTVLGQTILTVLMAGLQLPIVLTKLAYFIDNPWSVSCDRATAAGLILADSLMANHLGRRPITLVGFSLGARVIFSCLKELADKGAYGIVQNVYLFGAPLVAKKDEWLRARSVIAGRFVNGYASNDWILGYLFRATSGGISRVAGLASVEGIPGLENMNVTDDVNGHMAYRAAMPKLLRKLNWEVESDEFTEIEDPDPENHARRQRELIQEIEAARKKAEEKPNKRRFGLFRRGKLAEKNEWENYQTDGLKKSPQIGSNNNGTVDPNANILFDIDAIRKELISEQIEVRELASTQPTMAFTSINKDGQKEVEYLRLPPDIKPEEIAKMKLPPRPDDLNDGPPVPAPLKRDSTQRTQSTPTIPQQTLNRSPKRFNDHYDEYEFDQPKEIVSTLPPLRLSPRIGPSSSRSPVDRERPEIKRHDTEPMSSITAPMAGLAVASPIAGLASPELARNAWADEDDGEIKMTFE